MKTPRITPRRTGAGLTAFAAAAAVTVLAAPSAYAAPTAVSVSDDKLVVGEKYTISTQLGGASVGLLVYFSDNGEFIGAPKVPWPPGHSSIEWKPSTAGQHILTVEQGGHTQSIVVEVSKAPTGTGSSGSGSKRGGTGSFGSGSAGSS
ncbi:hypothetical protein [Nocardia sp. XZ_19_385]|uniref:hypothetical protein n=1 Tax=Nocardia sp. XZ_19_385 TaxID=2769488 RepID=UPI00188FB480|nr:hypothetical protein [Nocardia sp. XZ_19_385]